MSPFPPLLDWPDRPLSAQLSLPPQTPNGPFMSHRLDSSFSRWGDSWHPHKGCVNKLGLTACVPNDRASVIYCCCPQFLLHGCSGASGHGCMTLYLLSKSICVWKYNLRSQCCVRFIGFQVQQLRRSTRGDLIMTSILLSTEKTLSSETVSFRQCLHSSAEEEASWRHKLVSEFKRVHLLEYVVFIKWKSLGFVLFCYTSLTCGLLHGWQKERQLDSAHVHDTVFILFEALLTLLIYTKQWARQRDPRQTELSDILSSFIDCEVKQD